MALTTLQHDNAVSRNVGVVESGDCNVSEDDVLAEIRRDDVEPLPITGDVSLRLNSVRNFGRFQDWCDVNCFFFLILLGSFNVQP